MWRRLARMWNDPTARRRQAPALRDTENLAADRFERLIMEVDADHAPPPLSLPRGYHWTAWDPAHLDDHARVKFSCFANEPDARIFPCLRTLQGCRELMVEIVTNWSFLPATTWLIQHDATLEYVACVQTLLHGGDTAMIQNLGVTPEHRHKGLGTLLLLKCVERARQTGLRKVRLEVTASNHHAVHIYRKCGFVHQETRYRFVRD